MFNSSEVKALVFDLMGTCADWHTTIVSTMLRYPPPPPLTHNDLPALASEWRAEFFRTILASFEAGEESPDIDTVHANLLDKILNRHGVSLEVWSTEIRTVLVQAWHQQQGTDFTMSRA